MIIYTDSIGYAETVLAPTENWRRIKLSRVEKGIRLPAGRLFTTDHLHRSSSHIPGFWQYALLVEEAPASQYDLMVEMSGREQELPDGIICLAGAGCNFHGQRGRPWAALPGNIHLTAYLSPKRPIHRFHIGFSLLAAVSMIEAIDSLKSLTGRAKIKWVNDILIDGAKVAGFLATTSSSGNSVSSAVLGIGLNVETAPRFEGDAFVPKAASLRDFMPSPGGCSQKEILLQLLHDLDNNYRLLLSGRSDRLLDTYRRRSIVVGRRVKIMSDAPTGPSKELAAGRILAIGENLELFLDGVKDPVTRGRLVFMD